MWTIIAASTLSLSLLPPSDQPPPRTAVSSGELSGVWEGDVAAFLGVPYAAAPIGPRRWRAPQSPPTWETTLAADRFSKSCVQTLNPEGGTDNPWTREYSTQGEVSEDCLYLNIWTGMQKKGELQPVLVWVHGGAFINGAGSIPIYHGAALAKRGIVVVTINYRVGVFGFLAHPELSAESSHGVSGNYGLLDIVAALEWLRGNIAAFGGDPEQLTLAGQSAGARAVQALIQTPLAEGLFARAILQSRPRLDPLRDDLKTAEAAGMEFATSKDARSIEELRTLSSTDVSAGPEWIPGRGARFVPVFDGWFFEDHPAAAIEKGTYHDTPVMAGITADEGSARREPVTLASYQKHVTSTYRDAAEALLALYPADTDAQGGVMTRAIDRDRGLASVYSWAKARLAKSTQPVYAYLFEHVEPGPNSARYGAFHSSEIPYVFQTLDAAPERGFTERDRKVSDVLARYWVAFVKTGVPDVEGLAAWPELTAKDGQIMALSEKPHARPVVAPEKLLLLEPFTR